MGGAPFFQDRGTLPGDAPSYVVRDADARLLDLCLAGKLAWVLAPRQSGKSSLVVRARAELSARGIASAHIDLTAIGSVQVTPTEWYLSLIAEMVSQLELRVDPSAWWATRGELSAVKRFLDFLQAEDGGRLGAPAVVFLDEIDSTRRLPFSSDDFFAALRAWENLRATNSKRTRVSFVLLGVASPSDLIADPLRTPFNVGDGVDLGDFDRKSASVLRGGLADVSAPDAVLDRVFWWTSGHPRLTQKLCLILASRPGATAQDVDRVVAETLFGRAGETDETLREVRRQAESDPHSRMWLPLYLRVLDGRGPMRDEASEEQVRIRLVGLVGGSRGEPIRARNRIYERVFNRAWVDSSLSAQAAGGRQIQRVGLFIACATPDRPFARELHEAARREGLAPFLDEVDLAPGDDWDRALLTAQERAAVTVILVGPPRRGESYYLREEVARAIAQGRSGRQRIVPIWLPGVDGGDPTQVPYGLATIPGIEWSNPAEVARSVARLLGGAGAARWPQSWEPLESAEVGLGLSRRSEAYEALIALLPSQFEELLLRTGAPREDMPPPSAPLSARAISLLQWIETQPESVRRSLSSTLLALSPGRFVYRAYRGALPSRWAQHQAEALSRVPHVGIASVSGKTVQIDEIFVPIELQVVSGSLGDHDRGGVAMTPEWGRTADLASALQTAIGAGFRGVVLVGPPGCGKTTLLHKQYLVDLQGSEFQPIYLRFASLGRITRGPPQPRTFAQWAEIEAEQAGFPGAGREALADRTRPLRFLLDGYDELGSPEALRSAADWIRSEVAFWPNSQFVITTRRGPWEAHGGAALQRTLLPFAPLSLTGAATAAFATKLLIAAARAELPPDASERESRRAEREARTRSEALVAAILGSDRVGFPGGLTQLISNPLMLSAVCIVYWRNGRLPQRRGELYRVLFETLVRGRERPGEGPSGVEPEVGRALLGPLAWYMLTHSVDLVERRTAIDVLSTSADARGGVRNRDPEALLHVFQEECGLLIEAGTGYVSFSHRSLLEYLAFEDARVRGRAGDLASRAFEPGVGEVVLLGMFDAPFQIAFFDALLAQPGRITQSAALVARCRSEAVLEPEPFARALQRTTHERASTRWFSRLLGQRSASSLTPGDLSTVLGLFRRDAPAGIREAALGLTRDADPTVRALAIEVSRGGAGAGATILQRVDVLDMEVVRVAPGEFLMGATSATSPGHDPAAGPDEGAPHRVRITRAFLVGRFPVTNAQYRLFVAATGATEPDSFRVAGFDAPDMPVTSISWGDAMAYCAWASGVTGAKVALPTEAQWEYAARGSDGRRFPWGSAEPSPDLAHFGRSPQPSGRSQPSAEGWSSVTRGPARVGGRPSGSGPFGAEEQAGNAWEWCLDWHAPFSPAEATDPTGPIAGAFRVAKGGSWEAAPDRLRSAAREAIAPESRLPGVGFRVVIEGPLE